MEGNIAAAEMLRMKNASAWSPHPNHTYTRRKLNGMATRYDFADGTRLFVYTNGDAAWWTAEAGKQRWRGWHTMNRQGR